MNKSEIIDRMSELNPKLHKSEIKELIAKLFSCMTSNIYEDNRIELRGFGVFYLRTRNSGVIRNPRYGISTPAKNPQSKVVFFKAGKEMAERVNNGY